MNPLRVRLFISIGLLFSVLVFVSIGFGTINHIEVTSKEIARCLRIRYGVFRYCVQLCDNPSKEKCDTIDYSKVITEYSTDYDDDSAFNPVMIAIGYACLAITFLVSLIPIWHNVSAKTMMYTFMSFGAAGIIGLISGCLYTEQVLDTWDHFKNEPYSSHEITTGRGWSFYVYVVGNSLTIVAGIASLMLTHGYSESQRF